MEYEQAGVFIIIQYLSFMFAPRKEINEMSNDDRSRKGTNWQRIRAMQHIGMGAVYIIIACLLFWVKTFGSISLSNGVAYALGSLLLLYGAFRIWRGFRDLKNGEQ